MSSRRWRAACALAVLAVAPAGAAEPGTPAGAAEPGTPAPPAIVDLGHGRYRVGRLKVDRGRGRLAARGTVIRDAPPLEYVAVGRKGAKAYEALLELAAEPIEFNLGCILIGLDASKAEKPERHFDPDLVTGDPVAVEVSWRTADGGRRTVDAADLVRLEDATLARDEWIYIGSYFLPGGVWAAAAEGSLIGFVHDPAPVIEHRTGILGRFGDVVPNRDVVPPVGTRVTLTVRRR